MHGPARIASGIAALLLVVPASAWAARSWQAPQPLPADEALSGSLQDYGSRERSIYFDNAGNALVEARDNSGTSPYFRYLVRPHAGALGSLRKYPPGIGNDGGARPLVNLSAAGEVLVDDTGTSLGNSFGPLGGTLASSTPTPAGDPSAVSELPSGEAAGIFIVSGAAPYVAFRAPGQGFDFAHKITVPLPSGATSAFPDGIVLDPDGGVLAVYASGSPGRLMQSYRPAGGSFGTPTAIDTPLTAVGGGASMAWSRAGHAVLAWFADASTQLRLYGATRGPGQLFPTATVVADNSTADGFLGVPYAAVSDTGTAVIGYTRGGTAFCNNGSVAEVATSTSRGVWVINTPAGSNSALDLVAAGGDRIAAAVRFHIGCGDETLRLYSGTGTVVSGDGNLLVGTLANFGAMAVGPSGDMLVGYRAAGASVQELRAFEDPAAGLSQTLTVSLAGNGKGKVTGSTINCPGTCSRSYATGALVTLTATPAGGSAFTGWSGACTGSGACKVTMSASRNVTASFSRVPAPSHSRITKAKINATKHTANFSFTARGATGFQCELIAPTKKGHKKPKLKFGSCRSPKSYKHLKAGKYTFLVRGVNHTGADPKPARRTFTLK